MPSKNKHPPSYTSLLDSILVRSLRNRKQQAHASAATTKVAQHPAACFEECWLRWPAITGKEETWTAYLQAYEQGDLPEHPIFLQMCAIMQQRLQDQPQCSLSMKEWIKQRAWQDDEELMALLSPSLRMRP